MANGTTRPPYRNSIQRIGRPNRRSPFPSSSVASQCIDFGNASPRSTPPRTPGSTSIAALPRCRFRKAMYSPFGVVTRSRAATSTLCLAANPAAAGVGVPSGLKLAETGGPVTRSSRSVWRSGTRVIRTVRRRGGRLGDQPILVQLCGHDLAELIGERGQPSRREFLAPDLEQQFAVHSDDLGGRGRFEGLDVLLRDADRELSNAKDVRRPFGD